jgi:prevent-host-death family protein
MVKNSREIAAGQFKAKCLSLLDEVARTGGSLVVTKRGKPVARVVPLVDDEEHDTLLHSVTFKQDIMAPIDVEWDASK